ncbi:MAG TPA: MFS transporter [Clostridia bacterium]|nr:MFS transporter [Clostridia bacterium]
MKESNKEDIIKNRGESGLPEEEGLNPEQSINEQFPDWKRKTALFLSGQAVSLFGSALVQYAIIWYITLNTKSGQMMTISALFGFLPQIVISLFAGVWADRYSRRLLIMLSDILIATSTLVLAILFLMGYKDIWLMFIVSGIRSFGTGIQQPAVNAMVPQIVPQEKLAKVNGINGSILTLIMLVSPAVSGVLLSFATIEAIFFIDIATAMIAVAIMAALKVPLHKKAAEKQQIGYLDDLRAGFRYTAEHPFVRSLLGFYLVFFFLITPVAFLTPLLVARTFGEEVWRLTANEMFYFAGSIVGGLAFTAWSGFKNRVHTITAAAIAFGLLTALLGVSRVFWIYLIVMFLEGVGMPFFSNPLTVLLQEKVDMDMQGRVFSMLQIVSSTAMPVGMLVFGPLADVMSIELLLIITGVLMIVAGASIYYSKGFRTVS